MTYPTSEKVYEDWLEPPRRRYFLEFMNPGTRHYIFSRNRFEGGLNMGIDALNMVRHWMVTPDD